MQKKIKLISKSVDFSENENSSFEETGYTLIELNVDFVITQTDMERDLIQKTVGKFIKPDPHGNQN